MRNLSKAFLRVNAILSFVFMGLFILAAVVFFIVGSPLVSQYIENEGGAIGYTIGMMVGGAAFLFAAAMALISAIVSNKARALQTKGALVTAIVFSALSATAFGIAGGVLGLVQNLKEERRDRRNNIVDAQ